MTSLTGSQQLTPLRVLLSTRRRVFPHFRLLPSHSSFNTCSFLSVRAGVPRLPGTSGTRCAGAKAAERHVAARPSLVCRLTEEGRRYGASAPSAKAGLKRIMVGSVFTEAAPLLFQEARRPPEPGTRHAPPIHNLQRGGQDRRQQDRRVPGGCSLPTQVRNPSDTFLLQRDGCDMNILSAPKC